MKLRRRHKKQHGTKTTLGLVIILVLILLVIWSEFISGPNRVKEQIYTQRVEKIEKQNKHIKGISEHVFDYTTYQGYDDTTLYWYNAKSELITSRDIETLNYKRQSVLRKRIIRSNVNPLYLGMATTTRYMRFVVRIN